MPSILQPLHYFQPHCNCGTFQALSLSPHNPFDLPHISDSNSLIQWYLNREALLISLSERVTPLSLSSEEFMSYPIFELPYYLSLLRNNKLHICLLCLSPLECKLDSLMRARVLCLFTALPLVPGKMTGTGHTSMYMNEWMKECDQNLSFKMFFDFLLWWISFDTSFFPLHCFHRSLLYIPFAFFPISPGTTFICIWFSFSILISPNHS